METFCVITGVYLTDDLHPWANKETRALKAY